MMPAPVMPPHSVRLVWITPDAEALLIYMAKVSNPERQHEPAPRLIRYMMDHGHWGPFEMVNLCIEVTTTRAIGRQLLRHRTIAWQEFSQRYADPTALGELVHSPARAQHPTNRQASVEMPSGAAEPYWKGMQSDIWERAMRYYVQARELGIAKELARNVLPEGLTPTRMYGNMPLRTAIHFCTTRSLKEGAQTEAAEIAQGVAGLLEEHFSQTWAGIRAAEKREEKG